jgi:anti-sigma regulatory factor (Ser/Thr protein kinase)
MAPLTTATPEVEDLGWFRVADRSAVGTVRLRAMSLAEQHGYGEGRRGEVGIVVAELATNLVRHAGEGSILLRVLRAAPVVGIEVVAIDRGPGIADLRAAVRDGQSATGTLGIGLGAVSRLATSWDAHSVPGRGTVVVATMWPRDEIARGVPGPIDVAALTRPIEGETVCGDGYAVRRDPGVLRVLLCDGLGHGPLAAAATCEAHRLFREADPQPPAQMLTLLHGRLSGTRGAAAAVAEVDGAAGSVRYAGMGNITGALVSSGQRRVLLSQPGIVGHRGRSVREFTYETSLGDLLVLHTDGVRVHWELESYPGLTDRTPLVVAATLLRDAGTRRDDASVLVARISSAGAAPRDPLTDSRTTR